MAHFRALGLSLLLLGPLSAGLAAQPAQLLSRRGFFGVATKVDPKGVAVVQLFPGGTASALNLQVGDILVSGNGTDLKSPNDLVSLAHRLAAGDKVTLLILRDGKNLTLTGKMVGRAIQTDPTLDVIYDQVESEGHRVRVIVTKPKGSGPYPAFFLIGGIGAYSLDGNFGNILYGNILDPVAHAGYVTIRVDKPGQGDSQGPAYPQLTFQEELDAYVQAAKYAESLPYVDKGRIAIYGHSMGGTFAPLVGSKVPVKAVIVNGTLFQSFTEYMLENSRRQGELDHQDEGQLNEDQVHLAEACHYLFEGGLSIGQLRSRHPELDAFLKSNFGPGETFSGVGIPFFRQLSQTNLAAVWKASSGDTLAIYAENDFLSGRTDHERIVAWVNKLRPNTAKLVILKNTDHGFKETVSMEDSFKRWSQPGGKLNPSIVSTLLDYLKTELG